MGEESSLQPADRRYVARPRACTFAFAIARLSNRADFRRTTQLYGKIYQLLTVQYFANDRRVPDTWLLRGIQTKLSRTLRIERQEVVQGKKRNGPWSVLLFIYLWEEITSRMHSKFIIVPCICLPEERVRLFSVGPLLIDDISDNFRF